MLNEKSWLYESVINNLFIALGITIELLILHFKAYL